MDSIGLAQHIVFLQQIVRLKLWFVYHWLMRHPEEELPFVLRRRVDLYRKTILWRGKGFPTEADFAQAPWRTLEEQLGALRVAVGQDAAAFEKSGYALLRDLVESNAPYDYAAMLAGKGFQCGCLGYTPSNEGPTTVDVHITNTLRPRSPLDEPAVIYRALADLMVRARAELGADRLAIASWLNSYPRWLALWPAEYRANLGPDDEAVWNGLGHWGQFVDARGGFHAARAAHFRQSGRLPYLRRTAWCSFAALQDHLIQQKELAWHGD